MTQFKDECEALIKAADADGDGNIDYEEFGSMLFERTKTGYNRQQRLRSRIRKESIGKNPFSKESYKRTRATHIISHEPRRDLTPSVFTTLVATLSIIFITASVILIYVKT